MQQMTITIENLTLHLEFEKNKNQELHKSLKLLNENEIFDNNRLKEVIFY